jgi:hypothetical protein
LTLETVTFLAADLRATDFGAAFFVLAAGLAFAEVFLAARGLAAALRASGLAAVALLALGLDGDFALTARFVLFAVGFAFERDVDRLKPFVRLLLMCGNLKRLLTRSEQPWIAPQLTTDTTLNQRRQVFAGALKM